jgi:hypothetical protein
LKWPVFRCMRYQPHIYWPGTCFRRRYARVTSVSSCVCIFAHHRLNNSFTKNGVHSAIPRDALISQGLGACGLLADRFNPQGFSPQFPRRAWGGSDVVLVLLGDCGSVLKSFFIVFTLSHREAALQASSCPSGLRVLRDYVPFGTPCTSGLLGAC